MRRNRVRFVAQSDGWAWQDDAQKETKKNARSHKTTGCKNAKKKKRRVKNDRLKKLDAEVRLTDVPSRSFKSVKSSSCRKLKKAAG